jgi:PKD repeat protein
MTPPHVEGCFGSDPSTGCSAGFIPSRFAAFCAYHENTILSPLLIYADDPYVPGNPGCEDGNHPNGFWDGEIEGGLSHEHNESITDPLPNSGWTDFATGETTGYEVADKCNTGKPASEFGTPLGEVEIEEHGAKVKAKYNQIVNGHFYWYQQEWSNQGAVCLQRLTFSGAEPSATFTSKTAGGNALTFNAAQSSAPGGVVSRYSWQFADESAPEETSTPTVTHTFAKAGYHLIALTVYSQNGTSFGSADILKTGQESPSAAFSVTTPAPAATVPTQFDASSSSGSASGAIRAYEWNFGDGSQGAGQRPLHTYAKPGTYSVTLFIEDMIGQLVTISHQVTVGEAPPPSGGGGGGGSGSGESGSTSTGGSSASVIPAPVSVPPAIFAATGEITLLGAGIPIATNGTGAVRLACAGTATCTGKLTLTVKIKGRGKHARARTVTLASARFSIAPGATGSVALKLNVAGRAQLRAQHGRLGATLTIVKSAPAPQTTRARIVQLKLKAKR